MVHSLYLFTVSTPLPSDDDETGIKTIIDQLNNFKVIVQSVFYSIKEENQ